MSDSKMAHIILGNANLLLPQSCVVTIEMVENIDTADSVNGSSGTLKSGDREWPVYVLDEDLKVCREFPPEYKYCVAISKPDGASFSLLCEQVGSVIVNQEQELKPLQACMGSDANPIDALVFKDEKLMFVSDVEAMQLYLNLESAA